MRVLSTVVAAAVFLSSVSAQSDFAGSLYLPPKTYSGVCPAIEFEQGWREMNGRYYVKFTPRDANLDFKVENTKYTKRSTTCTNAVYNALSLTHTHTLSLSHTHTL